MAGIVLIHAPWFGGWTWHRVSPILRKMGHTVIDRDMPGTGAARAEKEKITMQDQLDQIYRWADEINGPVHLVAHAMAGVTATEFTERYPHQVRSLTYIASLFGSPGEAAITIPYTRTPNSRNKFTDEGEVISLDRDTVAKMAFTDCGPEDKTVFANKVEEISWDPPMIPLPEKTGHWHRTQRGYILCEENQLIFRVQQLQMTVRHKCSPVAHFKTGHFPSLTHPQETAETINEFVGRVEPPGEHRAENSKIQQNAHLKVV